MRPGNLAGTPYWFSGALVEIEHERSAEPVYVRTGRVYGKTWPEFKTKIDKTSQADQSYREPTIVDRYRPKPLLDLRKYRWL